jgi:hypothetical protein
VYLPPGLVPPRVVVVGDVVVDPLGGRGLLRRGRLVEGVVALVFLARGLGYRLPSGLDVVLAAVGLLLVELVLLVNILVSFIFIELNT